MLVRIAHIRFIRNPVTNQEDRPLSRKTEDRDQVTDQMNFSWNFSAIRQQLTKAVWYRNQTVFSSLYKRGYPKGSSSQRERNFQSFQGRGQRDGHRHTEFSERFFSYISCNAPYIGKYL